MKIVVWRAPAPLRPLLRKLFANRKPRPRRSRRSRFVN